MGALLCCFLVFVGIIFLFFLFCCSLEYRKKKGFFLIVIICWLLQIFLWKQRRIYLLRFGFSVFSKDFLVISLRFFFLLFFSLFCLLYLFGFWGCLKNTPEMSQIQFLNTPRLVQALAIYIFLTFVFSGCGFCGVSFCNTKPFIALISISLKKKEVPFNFLGRLKPGGFCQTYLWQPLGLSPWLKEKKRKKEKVDCNQVLTGRQKHLRCNLEMLSL